MNGIFSCSNVQENKTLNHNDSTNVTLNNKEKIYEPINNLDTFRNIEIIDYCFLFPFKDYKETFPESNEKAWHTFIHKTKKGNEIYLKGLLRSDTSISIEDYFANTYESSEELGEVILEKAILNNRQCFYAKGYMSNLIYDYRFVEVYWLRKDDVVIFEAQYDIKDTVLWDERLQLLLKQSSFCN